MVAEARLDASDVVELFEMLTRPLHPREGNRVYLYRYHKLYTEDSYRILVTHVTLSFCHFVIAVGESTAFRDSVTGICDKKRENSPVRVC
jgi:hypothetical protein